MARDRNRFGFSLRYIKPNSKSGTFCSALSALLFFVTLIVASISEAQVPIEAVTTWIGSSSSHPPFISEYPSNHVCQHRNFDHLRVDWCVDYGDRKRNPDVLYNFHGSGGSADDWRTSSNNRSIVVEWARLHIAAPTVITISFGEEWLLSDVSLDGQKPLYKLTVETLIPFIEAELGGVYGRRFILGLSMGGFNGAELFLKDGQLFDRVALICPVMSAITPFSSSTDVASFVSHHQPYVALRTLVSLMRDLREEFATPEIYAQHNPLALIETANLKSSRLFVSCADDDEFGFYDGAKRFAEAAKLRGINATWVPVHGGHCVEDSRALARFFAP